MRRRWAARAASGPIAAHVLLHSVEFLLLIVGQQGFDAVVGALRDGARLGATVFLRERFVLHERLHLLLAIYQQGLDLALLIGCEVQRAGEMSELSVGIHAHAAPTLGRTGLTLVGGRGRGVLSESGAGDAQCEQAAKGQSCEFGLHRVLNPPIHVRSRLRF